MSVSVSTTNKPLNPRAQDLSPKGYNRAALYSGKALDFDGVNDDINVTPAPIGAESAVSFSGYLKTTQSFSSVKGIISKGTNGFGDFVIAGRGTDKLGVYFQTNSAAGGYHLSTTSINDGEWYFFTVTWENSSDNLKIYINGSLENTQTIAGDSVKNTDTKLAIGAFSNDSNYFDGELANVKIFNTALTAAQVADLYLNPEKIVPDGVASSALKLWLPMMEGAGTTAYDGSGNGNHGTINGATWVSGIGAPVAQTALVSWNKGTNLVTYSEQFDNAAWTKSDATITANAATSPDGYANADKIVPNTTNARHILYQSITASTAHIFSVFAKASGQNFLTMRLDPDSPEVNVFFNLSTGTIGTTAGGSPTMTSYGNGWYRCSVTYTPSGTETIYAVLGSANIDGTIVYAGNGTDGILIYGAQLEAVDSLGPYVRTGEAAQTSPVLLPQGLTANKDITGVNAFESARNPYALNLDGSSWGEVHDNASLDFGTGGFTLEVWAKMAYENTGSSYNGVLGLGDSLTVGATAYIYTRSIGPRFFINGSSFTIATTLDEGNWHHLVVTRTDAGAIQTYYDGAEGTDSGTEASTMTNALNKFIGRDVNTNRYYHDQIALPRIYNRALTATEVARNYNADRSKFGL